MTNSATGKPYDRIIFFDCETTGLRPDQDDQIIELAALSLDVSDGSISEMDEFIYLTTKPELPAKIAEITNITPWDLATNGISEEAALEKFISLFGEKTILAAHNAQFDLLFVAYALLRYRQQHPEWLVAFNRANYIDTLTVYKDRASYPHRLESAIDHYGLAGQVQNTHRAIDDARALHAVARAMKEERDDLGDYVNIFGFNGRYGVMQPTLKKVIYRQQDFGGMKEPGYRLPDMVRKEGRQR